MSRFAITAAVTAAQRTPTLCAFVCCAERLENSFNGIPFAYYLVFTIEIIVCAAFTFT